jgi:cytidylate kinase
VSRLQRVLTSRGPRLTAGKSTLAQQLAARLNLPNVLQTDIIYQVPGTVTIFCLCTVVVCSQPDQQGNACSRFQL